MSFSSFSHLTKYNNPCLLELHPPHPLLHLLCMLIANFKQFIKNYVFKILILIAQKSNSINGFWSAAGACMSFLYFIKYNNSYCHKGLRPPYLLIHLYIRFIIIGIIFKSSLNLPKNLDFNFFKIQTGYSFWDAATNRQLIYSEGLHPPHLLLHDQILGLSLLC